MGQSWLDEPDWGRTDRGAWRRIICHTLVGYVHKHTPLRSADNPKWTAGGWGRAGHKEVVVREVREKKIYCIMFFLLFFKKSAEQQVAFAYIYCIFSFVYIYSLLTISHLFSTLLMFWIFCSRLSTDGGGHVTQVYILYTLWEYYSLLTFAK